MRILRQPTMLVLLAAVSGGPLAAQERPKEAAPEQRTHVVRKGDTLWDLAGQYLANPFQWPRIFEANRSEIRDPHWIYPDQRFVIPPVVPADAVAVEQPEPEQGVTAAEAVARAVSQEAVDVAARAPGRTLFYPSAELEEPMTVGRALEMRERESLLQVQPGESEAAAWLADRGELQVVGRVVQELSGRNHLDRLQHSMHPYELVYVSYEDGDRRPAVGERLLLVDIGRGAGRWGRVIEPTAVATVRELADEVMIVQLTRQFGPVHPGNLALPAEQYAGAPAARVAVAEGPEGEVIDFRTRQPHPSVPDQAFIDLGRAQGIDIGDELVAYWPERPSADNSVWLPEEPVARLTVVRVEEESATVRVAGLKHAALERGLPVRLVARTR